MADAISVRAGRRAIGIIRDEGLDPSRIKVLAGASGSAKFLVLTGIDRVLMDLFKGRTEPLYLIGTSIGAFRMAAFCQNDPAAALGSLEREYIAQHYQHRPTREEINRETLRILDAFIDEKRIEQVLNHPFMRISFLANRCRGLLKSEALPLQWMGLGLAAGANLMNRDFLGLFFERALFCAPGELPPYAGMNRFPLKVYGLTKDNFKPALLSSGAIPAIMAGVSDIPGVKGMFRDGGILDYHLDIPFLPGPVLPGENQLVLFPHFYEHITPGWFDKRLNRLPAPDNMADVVLIAPSPAFVQSLPLGKIPDRKDFYGFKGRDGERMAYWKETVNRSRELGLEFVESIASGRIRQMVKPL
ncbi:MAG: patatin-like phospholipase family protein [Desulfobacula sp.]|nr:patatin-like phospholipase family protein [Desulfobacula sp.]